MRYAERAGEHGLTVPLLVSYVRAEGLREDDGEPIGPGSVRAELVYLEDKKLMSRAFKQLSPEVARWRVTGDGRDYLASQG